MGSTKEDDERPNVNGSSAFFVETWLTPTQSKIKSLFSWPDPEEVPLQVALTGTAGTGKKKLAEMLGKKLNLPVISGIARNVNKIGYNLNQGARWQDEMMIMLGQLWEQMEYDEFVTAGSLIDIVAHCHYFTKEFGTKKDEALLRAVANVCNSISNNDYSVVFYLPLPSRVPKGDGIRSTDAAYLKAIDKYTRYYLDAYDLDYFPLQGSVKEKFQSAYAYLDDFGLLLARD